jgi:hypothetical protein
MSAGIGRLGAALRQSAIVTVEGSGGWDDYRLLHHFDDREHLDRICLRRSD